MIDYFVYQDSQTTENNFLWQVSRLYVFTGTPLIIACAGSRLQIPITERKKQEGSCKKTSKLVAVTDYYKQNLKNNIISRLTPELHVLNSTHGEKHIGKKELKELYNE